MGRGDAGLTGTSELMTSINEVAKLARVSIATVSNTINRPEIVLPATRNRVNAAIAELGYIPNQNARQMSGVTSQVLGLVVTEASNPFFVEIGRAVQDAAAESGHLVIVGSSEGSNETQGRYLRMLAGQRVRGVIVTPADATEVPREGGDHLSLVLLDHPGMEGMCSVTADHLEGGRIAMEYLLDLGHERVAFLGESDIVGQHADRYAGARIAAEDRGLDPSDVLVRHEVPRSDIASGVAAVDGMLADSPTAIFCANDVLAFGVYRGLALRGLSVPTDVSLIGYDDVEVAADWFVPLSSVRQPTTEMGRVATRLVLEHSATASHHVHEHIVFRPRLIVRQSTGPPPL